MRLPCSCGRTVEFIDTQKDGSEDGLLGSNFVLVHIAIPIVVLAALLSGAWLQGRTRPLGQGEEDPDRGLAALRHEPIQGFGFDQAEFDRLWTVWPVLM